MPCKFTYADFSGGVIFKIIHTFAIGEIKLHLSIVIIFHQIQELRTRGNFVLDQSAHLLTISL